MTESTAYKLHIIQRIAPSQAIQGRAHTAATGFWNVYIQEAVFIRDDHLICNKAGTIFVFNVVANIRKKFLANIMHFVSMSGKNDYRLIFC